MLQILPSGAREMRNILAALTAGICVLALTGPADARKAGGKNLVGTASGLSRQPAESDTKDGAGLVDQWLHSAQALNDYSFNYQITVTKPNGSQVTEKGNLWFKRPRLLRIEVTGGPKSGAVAVLESDGKVHAHMGGALKMFNVSLSPDSNMLRSVHGWPMVDSDFTSLAQAVEGYIKSGCTAKVTINPIAVDGRSGKYYDWQLNHPDGTIYKRALFDSDTMQPVEWWDYINAKLFAHSLWTNFKPNQGISDKVFTTGGK